MQTLEPSLQIYGSSEADKNTEFRRSSIDHVSQGKVAQYPLTAEMTKNFTIIEPLGSIEQIQHQSGIMTPYLEDTHHHFEMLEEVNYYDIKETTG